MKFFNMVIKILMQICMERCKPNKKACHPVKCDVINDTKLFPTVYVANFLFNRIRYPVSIASALIRIINIPVKKHSD